MQMTLRTFLHVCMYKKRGNEEKKEVGKIPPSPLTPSVYGKKRQHFILLMAGQQCRYWLFAKTNIYTSDTPFKECCCYYCPFYLLRQCPLIVVVLVIVVEVAKLKKLLKNIH